MAAVYNARMDLRLNGGLRGSALRGRRRICGFMKKTGAPLVKCWDIYTVWVDLCLSAAD